TSLRGTVTDPKGAVLQSATVTLNDAATGFSRTTKSGSDGVYQFLQVPPATYTLTVVATGFGTLKRDNVTLQVSLPATVDITLDGIDNNDQELGLAFQGALRTPLESIQEFRVTTSNSNADAGRSSGAQVALLTKSGTNSFHGSVYEYNRSNVGEANDWFNKHN